MNQWSFFNEWKSKLKLVWCLMESRAPSWPCKPWKWSKWPSKWFSKRKKCSLIHILASTSIKFPFKPPNNFILHIPNRYWQKSHSMSSSHTSAIDYMHFKNFKKWSWSQIFEAAAFIGRIISFKVQIPDNNGEKKSLSMLFISTNILYAKWNYSAVWMEIWWI